MNERIKELAEQAGFVDKGNNITAYLNFDHEKFAELIVRECFKAAMIESKGHMNPIDLMKGMKERVGVEE